VEGNNFTSKSEEPGKKETSDMKLWVSRKRVAKGRTGRRAKPADSKISELKSKEEYAEDQGRENKSTPTFRKNH